MNDDLDKPSKSQRKRDSDALQDLGKQLTELTPTALKKCALPDTVLDAVREYQRLPNKHGARHRQMQFIGKVMRDLTDEDVIRINAQINQDVAVDKRRYMALEDLRANLLAETAKGFDQLAREQPLADMEQVRLLIKQAQKEQQQDVTPLASRKLFQLLRQLYGV